MENAAHRSGRDPQEIKLLAVTKNISIVKVKQAVDSGQRLFGENYLQEAKEKIAQLDKNLTWHFIGSLQTNKAKLAAELFHLIETVDRIKLAKALNDTLAPKKKTLSILLQVNIGLESQKSGVLPSEAESLLREINELDHLKVNGLMAIPPFLRNPDKVRPYFKQMKKMLDDFQTKELFNPNEKPQLSMGMSGDYEVAIEEGATLIRLGTALFGERD